MPRLSLRVVLLSVVVLALGMLTTVAIAWVGSAFEVVRGSAYANGTVDHGAFTCRYWMDRGYTCTRVGLNWDDVPDGTQRSAGPGNAVANPSSPSAPYWSQAWIKQRPARPPGTWGTWPHESGLDEVAAGWPFRALWCESDEAVQDPVTRNAVYQFRGGITLTTRMIKEPKAIIFIPRVLPYRPIYLGLIANTLLFSIPWAMVFLVRPFIRWRRGRQGRCPACNYDLRGLAAGVNCPECGHSALQAATH